MKLLKEIFFRALVSQLNESKHLATHRGMSSIKDQAAMMHATMLPNAAHLQRLAHQTSKSRLDTKLRSFSNLLLHRIRQILSNEVRRDLAVADIKDEMRQVYYEAFNLGVGGSTAGLHPVPELISVEDRRWVESSFTHEMRYFNRFLGQALNRELTPPQIEQRVRMYTDAVRAVYDAGRVSGSHPHSLIYWVYNPEAHHCESCLYLRDHSPYTKRTLPTTPRAGGTECLSNCKCHLRIVISDPELVRNTESRSRSKSAHLTYLNQLKSRRSRR